jgi:hypothetical protein
MHSFWIYGLTLNKEIHTLGNYARAQTLGEKLHRLDKITSNNEQISAHYIWGYNENDMRHTFQLIADLTTLEITINHFR